MTLDELVAIEQIRRLKYKYVRCLDLKLWDEIAECFTDDAVAQYSGGKYAFEGRDAILEFLTRTMSDEGFLSSHKVHHPEIDLTGPDTAVATWALDDVVVIPALEVTIRGAAFYEDEYLRVDDIWRIKRTGYRRVYEEMESRGDARGLRLTASYWATGGRSDIDA